MVIEVTAEFDDIPVREALMNFDFAAQLLLGPLLGERALLDDLDGFDFFGFFWDQFVAASEPSFAQEIALHIAPHTIFLKIAILNDQQFLMCWIITLLRSGCGVVLPNINDIIY